MLGPAHNRRLSRFRPPSVPYPVSFLSFSFRSPFVEVLLVLAFLPGQKVPSSAFVS